MQYQYISYIWILMLSGFMTLFLGIYTLLKCRNAKGAVSFAIAMFIVTLWSVPNALEMSATVLPVKLFWANMQYIAYCYSPVILFLLCLEFTGHESWMNFRKIFLIFIIPTITFFLVWTDGFHGLVRYGIQLDYSGAFPVIKKQYGIAFYIHALHSHLLNLMTMFILLRAVFIRKTIYRKQAVALFIGVSLIVIPNLLYITRLSPIKGYDITPVFFGPAGIIMAWSILRYRMFDLVPLARATVIENMDAGIMVLDLQDRILDINTAFTDMIELPPDQITAKNAGEVCRYIPKLIDAILDKTIPRVEFTMIRLTKPKVYEALLSILSDKNGHDIGRLVMIYDITEKKKGEQEYLKSQWNMAVREERKRMVRDLHDNMGQVLGFINMQAQAIQKELLDAGDSSFNGKLDKLIDVTQTAHQQLREYIHDVRNSELIEVDFIAALDREITNYELQTSIQVDKKITSEFSEAAIAPKIRIHILNIIKESMNNVRKHAQASRVMVTCDCQEDVLLVMVSDDGKGFEVVPTGDNQRQRFGLDIMKERAGEMGGTIEITSKPGEGSFIILKVPLVKGD